MDGQQLADTITFSILVICVAAVICVFLWKVLD